MEGYGLLNYDLADVGDEVNQPQINTTSTGDDIV